MTYISLISTDSGPTITLLLHKIISEVPYKPPSRPLSKELTGNSQEMSNVKTYEGDVVCRVFNKSATDSFSTSSNAVVSSLLTSSSVMKKIREKASDMTVKKNLETNRASVEILRVLGLVDDVAEGYDGPHDDKVVISSLNNSSKSGTEAQANNPTNAPMPSKLFSKLRSISLNMSGKIEEGNHPAVSSARSGKSDKDNPYESSDESDDAGHVSLSEKEESTVTGSQSLSQAYDMNNLEDPCILVVSAIRK